MNIYHSSIIVHIDTNRNIYTYILITCSQASYPHRHTSTLKTTTAHNDTNIYIYTHTHIYEVYIK